jgi:hypothetical protein
MCSFGSDGLMDQSAGLLEMRKQLVRATTLSVTTAQSFIGMMGQTPSLIEKYLQALYVT